ncbi:MAG: yqfD [Anaerosolibacter sp.]|uniref:sporulation protein YqfD n=1 Tax=Anaerosolibacter sp. TaxID=1872527 RepID=UPI002626183F|nr:sporulation protein YqfD [Anaerosolibacter sp.]MDF2548154.1 yqfD [Anaerosolibacter sp.]
MLVVKIWNYIRGYVVIRIEGLTLEKFINFAIARGIYLWDIVRIDYTTLEAKIGLTGYKELRHIVKKAGCKVKINTKIGYPFFMHRIKARKMLMFGFMIAIFMVMLTTSFVWDIEVIGAESIEKEEIVKKLETLGLSTGIFKYKLDISGIETNIMIEMEELAWVGIELRGTKAIVEIVEKVQPPEKIPLDIPCDIIASKNGLINKVIAKSGDAMIQKGDIVKAGQLLVTGTILREGQDARYVHSLGEIYAKTYYEINDEMSIIKVNKIKTGKKFVKRTLKMGESQLTLSIGEVPFQNYVLETTHKRLPRWRNIIIPVEIILDEYFETYDQSEELNVELVKSALVEKMTVELVKQIPEDAEILHQDIKYLEEDNIIKAKLTIEVQEQIGVQKRINIF